jgi:hypothetical protein
MNWKYKVQGSHVHVKVYMNGALCGNLVFSLSEFEHIVANQAILRPSNLISFVKEEREPSVYDTMTEEQKRQAHNIQVQQIMRDGA